MNLKISGYIIRNGAGYYTILQPVTPLLPMHLTSDFLGIPAAKWLKPTNYQHAQLNESHNFLISLGITPFIRKVLLAITEDYFHWKNYQDEVDAEVDWVKSR
jgi:hypothetical protein